MFVQLIIAFITGALVVLSIFYLLPKVIDNFIKRRNRVFEIVFRVDYYQQPSLYNKDAKGRLIKSEPITVRIAALNEKEAIAMLDDIIKEKTKGELVRIREIKEKPAQA